MKSTHIFQTERLYNACEYDKKFYGEVIFALAKYLMFDYGDVCQDDNSMKSNDKNIVGKYLTSKGYIFILSDTIRSVSTIMFDYEIKKLERRIKK